MNFGEIAGLVIVGVVALYVLALSVGGAVELGSTAYKAVRYERRGICGVCKQKYVRTLTVGADQTYGPDQVSQDVCPNGHVSLVRGNRRGADWAGF